MPHEPVMPEKRQLARRMRRQPTEAEERLWRVLRGRRLDGIKVRRQAPFDPYVADFLCAEAMLVIEVDGGQHGGSARDERRTRFFKAKGYRKTGINLKASAAHRIGTYHRFVNQIRNKRCLRCSSYLLYVAGFLRCEYA